MASTACNMSRYAWIFVSGRIGLAQNRLPVTSLIEDAEADRLDDCHRAGGSRCPGRWACRSGVSGRRLGHAMDTRRWSCESTEPFCKLGGRYRNFIEVHLAKSLRIEPRVRHASAARHHHQLSDARSNSSPSCREEHYGYPGPLLLSPGRSIGLRMVPMEKDLRFAWEEMAQQMLDAQAQKVREGLQAALIQWARGAGEASDYIDNMPAQCLHPVGHWYEVANLLRNGTLEPCSKCAPS